MGNKQLTLLAKRIREAREQAHLSQAQLGEKVGVSDKAISSYEKARSLPSLPTLKQIARSTEQSVSFFTNQQLDNQALLHKLETVEKELAYIKSLLKKKK